MCDNSIENRDIISIPPKSIQNNSLNIDLIESKKFGKNILGFLKILLCITNKNFSYFYNNIYDLNIKNIGNLINENALAGYLVKSNTIVYKDMLDNNTFTHELLHMSSSIYDDIRVISFCGFSQLNYNNKFEIGKGINEGYTEYLNEKYFGSKKNTYIIEKSIVKSIETIIGQDIMKKFYFSADLRNLISELSKYSSIEETIDFIKKVDNINEFSKKYLLIDSIVKESKKNINDCATYLVSTYIRKLKNDFELNRLNKDEYIINLENFVSNLCISNFFDGDMVTQIRFLSEENIRKIIKKEIKVLKKKKR